MQTLIDQPDAESINIFLRHPPKAPYGCEDICGAIFLNVIIPYKFIHKRFQFFVLSNILFDADTLSTLTFKLEDYTDKKQFCFYLVSCGPVRRLFLDINEQIIHYFDS